MMGEKHGVKAKKINIFIKLIVSMKESTHGYYRGF